MVEFECNFSHTVFCGSSIASVVTSGGLVGYQCASHTQEVMTQVQNRRATPPVCVYTIPRRSKQSVFYASFTSSLRAYYFHWVIIYFPPTACPQSVAERSFC